MSPDVIGVVGLVAGPVSIVVDLLAIWLAVKFYQLSTESQRALEQSSRDIAAAVQKLETLFGSMYSHTFALVKERWRAMYGGHDDDVEGTLPFREWVRYCER